MQQIKFDEVEYFDQVLYICKTCQDRKKDCKIQSTCKNVEIFCKKFKRIEK